ncbi:MAG TPA: YXWGXW repeat-containing protein, partial [Polyangia bacterium]
MRSLGKLALGIALASLVGCFTTVDQGPPPAAPPPPAAEPVQFEPAPATAEIPELPTADPGEIMATSEPPEPVYEEQTPPPAPDHVWVPGYWDWTGAQWSWVYGGWRPPMVGYTYVAPYYEVVNGQVVYVRGYWNAGPPVVRAYGGVRISFVAAPRPVGYRPGVRVVVRPTAGVRVGVRPASVYVKVGPATRTPQPRPAVRPAPAHHAAPPPAHHAAPAAHPAPAPAAHP